MNNKIVGERVIHAKGYYVPNPDNHKTANSQVPF